MKYNDSYWEDIKVSLGSIPDIQKLKSKSILITGGTGMICSAVVDILLYLNHEFDYKVNIILAGRSKERTAKRFYIADDKADYQFVPFDAQTGFKDSVKADYILYGASPADPKSFESMPVETIMANVIGLKSALDSAKANPGCRLLYISSSEVYGKKDNKDPYKESDYGFVDILNPRSCYPNAKRLSETLCASYKKEFGVDFVIARPGHIYGPQITTTDSRATAQFTRKAIAGEPIVMKSAGTQLRSYTYTLDCASAILAILLNGQSGEAYNISNPHSIVTIRQIAEEFSKAAGQELVFENPTDQEKAGYNLMDNSSLDSKKLESLGWKAKFDVETGVRRTIELLK